MKNSFETYLYTIEEYSNCLKGVLIGILTNVKMFYYQPDVRFNFGAIGAEGFYKDAKLAFSYEIPSYGVPIEFFKRTVLNAIDKEIDRLKNK